MRLLFRCLGLAGWPLLLALATAPVLAQTPSTQTLRLATLAPEGSPWMRELRAAAAQVRSETAGRVEIRFFPGGVMGNDQAVLRRIRQGGQLQGGVLTSSELALVYPDASAYTLPFLFADWAEVDRVRPKVDPLLAAGFRERGFHMLGAAGIGFAYLMSTGRITSVEDVRRARLWVPQNDRITETTFRIGGANPISLPIADVFTSLQTGMVDMVANTPSGAVALQWHGRLRSLYDLPLAYVVGYVVVDLRAWQRIAAADQAVIDRIFAATTARVDATIRRDDAAALAAMRRQGLEVISPTPADAATFRDIGARAIAQLEREQGISPAILQAIREAQGRQP
ncbi:TRAP transporter substrate-binding protein DctP [Silanimonas sp.]|uniref:TRAP transporter substrate-binding protein DctP n=1 Tax=Silanimonas sp. TaxID=1929290 RepID=UPI001BBABCA8|nr:TRAP transporter substrate-binding protein DctP [Silanimonas sp.]MBS3896120.1 TRAP transporter substrate-binding protein DctP [Silanimonas sp.]MBS3923830.1 TRAP transporter substrate-binding protein DctP [Xanthomonadaceae bacterium]